MKYLTLILSLFLAQMPASVRAETPIKLALVGLVHDHARGFLPLLRDHKEFELVGIAESDPHLALEYSRRYRLDTNLFCRSLEELIARTNVQAVATFTSTFDHRRVVETCAAHHIDVMMEKPLAVNLEHARAIEAAAKRSGIQVVVNYETTWYRGNHAAYEIAHNQRALGELRKIVVHDGHQGPKEIGCSTNFLNWLTDPVLNGGGALMDFGCYGADLITWLMDGERPTSVTAVTQQIKPDVYPKVDDEATIVLTYPRAQGIIQASWNWPYNRKDLEVYGQTGYVLVARHDVIKVLTNSAPEREIEPKPLPAPEHDSLSYLAAVVRREIQPAGLSSLAVNLTVMEILDAARLSAETGRRVDLPKPLKSGE
jgi:predicted dehydrogenase